MWATACAPASVAERERGIARHDKRNKAEGIRDRDPFADDADSESQLRALIPASQSVT